MTTKLLCSRLVS